MNLPGSVVIALSLTLAAGCERHPDEPPVPGETTTQETNISGSITYRERMALPAGASATVTLFDASLDDDRAPGIETVTLELQDRQVPITFSLRVPASRAPERGGLRAVIRDSAGNALFTTDPPKHLALDTPSIDAGTLMLVRVRAGAGAGPGAIPAPDAWIATGNEPGWHLTIGEQVTLLYNYGQDEAVLPLPAPVLRPGGRSYESKNADHDLRVDVVEGICRDDMTGMPYPEAVTVEINGKTLSGCGGSPASLLTGAEWVVEDIGGKGIIDRSRATLNFDEDGRLTGRASCNTYGASWTLSGEGLTLSEAHSTLMACSPALTAQEREFLRLLESVQRFDIGADGALVLHSSDGGTILARRE